MKHDSTNYLYVTPLQNQGLVLALLLRAQVCLYGFGDLHGEWNDKGRSQRNNCMQD